MKIFRLRTIMLLVLLCLTAGLVLAQDATLEPVQVPAVDMPIPSPMETELIPCTADSTGPCDMIATSFEDIVGVWKHYLLDSTWNAPNGMAYQRFFPDGTFIIADTAEHTAQPFENYPTGTYHFDGAKFIIDSATGAPPPFDNQAVFQIRVLKYGDQPVALRFVAISDTNFIRLLDLTQVMMRVGE